MKNESVKARMNGIVQWLFLIETALIRIALGMAYGNYIDTTAVYDDWLLLEYADLSVHFSQPGVYSMVKTMSFPWMLHLIDESGIPYSLFICLLWIAAALLVFVLMKKLVKSRWIQCAAYTFVLFFPQAFVFSLIRVYRNAVLAPLTLILFTLMLLFYLECWSHKPSLWQCILISAGMAFVLPLLYFVKEDGFWISGAYILFILICAAGVIWMIKGKHLTLKKAGTGVLCLLMAAVPAMSLRISTVRYLDANEQAFGVRELNTRTEGELGKFVSNIYKIDSDSRTPIVWAPYDAIEKAFDASKTLSEYPELKDAVMHTYWFENGNKPIRGDFLTWVLRTALKDTTIWENEKQISDMFARVNGELEEAFEEGTLKKDSRISVSSSAVGRTLPEILHVIGLTFFDFFLLTQPRAGQVHDFISPSADRSQQIMAQRITNQAFPDASTTKAEQMKKHVETSGRIIRMLCWVYRILNLILLSGGILLWFFFFWKLCRNRWKDKPRPLFWKVFWSIPVLTALALGCCFGVCWFCEFIFEDSFQEYFIFYSSSAVGLLILILVLVMVLARKAFFWMKRNHMPLQNRPQ